MLSFLKVDRIVVALGLIGLGALMMLANLDRLDLLPALRIFWPALLIVWGLLELVVSFARRTS
jgi:LiaF transmembrane domain